MLRLKLVQKIQCFRWVRNPAGFLGVLAFFWKLTPVSILLQCNSIYWYSSNSTKLHLLPIKNVGTTQVPLAWLPVGELDTDLLTHSNSNSIHLYELTCSDAKVHLRYLNERWRYMRKLSATAVRGPPVTSDLLNWPRWLVWRMTLQGDPPWWLIMVTAVNHCVFSLYKNSFF